MVSSKVSDGNKSKISMKSLKSNSSKVKDSNPKTEVKSGLRKMMINKLPKGWNPQFSNEYIPLDMMQTNMPKTNEYTNILMNNEPPFSKST